MMTDDLSFASGPPDDHDGSMQSILLSTPTMPTTYCLTLQVTTWVPVVTAICLALSFAQALADTDGKSSIYALMSAGF